MRKRKPHNEETKMKISKSNTGEKSSQWKGDYAKYQALHAWIRKHHLPADHCCNPKCLGKSKEYQWALKKGKKYSRDIKDYQQMCRSCHRLMDITNETKEKISTSLKKLPKSGKKINCLVCGKEIYVYPSRINKKYCSFECKIKN